ncbi:AAA family ATPase [Pseudomonas fluorescens]|nr:AAA family ATPase [Pseudomonas fluorescens]
MDKKVIFAVAGSGKTTLVIDHLNLLQRALIITYTDNNYQHLRNRIIQKFGFIPSNITLMTYFSFLHGFCYRPLLQMQLGTRGLTFNRPSIRSGRLSRSEMDHYRDSSGRLYHGRLAKLMEYENATPHVIARIERFYDALYVDEVQDFAGNDFNLLTSICKAKVSILYVGDFYQHTFDTSRDGQINRTLHDDLMKYEKRFRAAGLRIDKETLGRSWRCGTTVCDFITTHLHINIGAHEARTSEIVTVEDKGQAQALHADSSTVKLFLQEHYKYDCYSQNWGASKGQDHYYDVCIIMGPGIWKQYLGGNLYEANPQTRNKLYVACSRARGSIYFVPEKLFKPFKQ